MRALFLGRIVTDECFCIGVEEEILETDISELGQRNQTFFVGVNLLFQTFLSIIES